jgi:hypothetical protein
MVGFYDHSFTITRNHNKSSAEPFFFDGRGLAPFSFSFWFESESDTLYDWRFSANQPLLVTSPLRLTTSNFIFQLNTCGYSPYVESYLMRGWVCRL